MQRGPRCELILKVEYEELGQLRSDYLSSLSEGGVFLRTPLQLPIGQLLRLTISFPGGLEPLSVTGEVRWVASQENHPQGLGIGLKDVDPATRARLEELVSRAASPPASAHGEPLPLRAVLLQANPVLRQIFRFQMERFARGAANHQVWSLDLACASSPEELLEAAFAQPPRIIILDFETLSVPPLELVNQLRGDARTGSTPVIVLGDSSGVPVDARTMYVKKPFSVNSLFRTLQLLLEG